MSSYSPLSEAASQCKLRARARHIDQLRVFPSPESPRPAPPEQHSQTLNEYKQWLVDCSKESNVQIQQAIAQKVLGGRDEISWPLALYAFMESAAVYLRDYKSFFEAVIAAKANEDGRAFELLDKSEEAIEEVAQAWGMTFVAVCDLVEQSPEGHSWWAGPFCGFFFPRQPTDKNACVGIAFKGTHPSRIGEDLVDVNYRTMVAPNGTLWDTNVSEGVYEALFNYYPDSKIKPYDHILGSLKETHLLNDKIMIHTTGHSLGASYASFCHMETVRRMGNAPVDNKFYIGDLYTFGSPRLGLNDWASAVRTAMGAQTHGHVWRTVDAGDVVTMIPPAFPFDANFIHLDGAWQISPTQAPIKLPSEIGTHPSPPNKWDIKPHQTTQYYAALRNAIGETTTVPCPKQDLIPEHLEVYPDHNRP